MAQMELPKLSAVFDVIPGADGKTWPRVQIINGPTAYTLTLPIELFETFVNKFAHEGRLVVEAAKAEASPIKTATPEQAKLIQRRSNGHAQRRR